MKSSFAIALAGLALVAAPGAALAQAAKKADKGLLLGTWYVSSILYSTADGRTVEMFGKDDGVIIFQPDGRFAQILVRKDIPRLASGNRETGTAEENKSVVQNSLALFGAYSLNEATGELVLHMDRSTFSNWNGTDQKRAITKLTAGELVWDNPAASTGGGGALSSYYKPAR